MITNIVGPILTSLSICIAGMSLFSAFFLLLLVIIERAPPSGQTKLGKQIIELSIILQVCHYTCAIVSMTCSILF